MVARTAMALLKRLGYAVTHAADGEAAWRILAQNPHEFDQLLLDLNMPHLGGIDLVRRVRTTDFAGRIVLMSGRMDESDYAAMHQLKIDATLPKPFLPEELKDALTESGLTLRT